MAAHRMNDVWARRHEIQPSTEMRERPAALEIYKRLPKTNCKQCRGWGGPDVCRPRAHSS